MTWSATKPASCRLLLTHFAQATKFPTDSFNLLKYLQGVPFDSETVFYYATLSAADTIKSSRNTISLRRSDGTEWATEELITIQFSYVKDLAESIAGENPFKTFEETPGIFSGLCCSYFGVQAGFSSEREWSDTPSLPGWTTRRFEGCICEEVQVGDD